MPIQILMPALSPTMTEGTLSRWLVKEGEKIAPGMVIAEIETDKATMEVEAVEEGSIGRILVPAGTEHVKVNAPIALLIEEGEAEPPPRPRADALPAGIPTPLAQGQPQVAARGAGPGGGRVPATPLARRLARERQIDLTRLKGSGPQGRIIKEDVDRASAGSALQAPAAAPRAAAIAEPARQELTTRASANRGQGPLRADDKVLALYDPGSFEIVPHDSMRRVIADRLTLSKQTVPHYYLSIECRIDALLSARQRLNGGSPKGGPRSYRLSVNDFIIKAMALALQQVPAANATWLEQGMMRHQGSDVGVAVAVEGGLYTPIVRHAELKSLSEISNEMKELAERARTRRLAPHEYQGGSTSISNLGMHGVRSFDAVINPPHATILAVGAGEPRPAVVDDRLEIATMMSCTLSCDHRVVDGAVGAALLASFKALIEDPVRMLV